MRLNGKRLPTVILGPALVLFIGLGALALGYVTAGSGAAPPSTALPEAPTAPLRGVVQSVSGDSLTLSLDGGTRSLRLTPSTQVEALRPASVDAILPGDWINAGALPHGQTVFALAGLVLLPQGSFTPPQ